MYFIGILKCFSNVLFSRYLLFTTSHSVFLLLYTVVSKAFVIVHQLVQLSLPLHVYYYEDVELLCIRVIAFLNSYFM